MTYLFNPGKAMDVLLELEKSWGGTAAQRMEAKYKSFAAQYALSAPKVGDDAANFLIAAPGHAEEDHVESLYRRQRQRDMPSRVLADHVGGRVPADESGGKHAGFACQAFGRQLSHAIARPPPCAPLAANAP